MAESSGNTATAERPQLTKGQEATRRSAATRSLAWTLLGWFLVLSMLPMSIVGIVSYVNATNSLQKDAQAALGAVATLKRRQIEAYFHEVLTDLQVQAESRKNAVFLQNLTEALTSSGKPVREFVGSFRWAMVVDKHAADLKTCRKTHGYHDILLVDAQGNVLFSVAGEDDLGTNLLDGRYARTRLGAACRQTLDTGGNAFSDFEQWEPSGGMVSGFVTAVLVDEDGGKTGLVAFQFPINQIDRIARRPLGLGESAEAYLVGGDLKMRSNSPLSKEDTVLGDAIDTAQTRAWRDEHGRRDLPIREKEPNRQAYAGYRGIPVIGTHETIEVCGVRLGIIAEIEEDEAFASAARLRNIVFGLLGATGLVVFVFSAFVARRIVLPVRDLTAGASRVAEGDLSADIGIESRNEIGELARSFNEMQRSLRLTLSENERQNWLKTGQTELSDRLRGELDLAVLGSNVVGFVAEYLGAQVGALYASEDDGRLRMIGSYAYARRKSLSNEFAPGEGLVGQAALEKKHIILTDCPEDYISVKSGLGEARPANILVYPLVREDATCGVLELASLKPFNDEQIAFLEQVADSIAITLNTQAVRSRQAELLEETQRQSEELQAQQEELRTANEELEEQTRRLKASEEKLKAQQEELQVTNEELEEKNELTQRQKTEVERARKDIEAKAEELAVASKYKSEFLANMSHELRTPLNSLLLLAQGLAGNRDGNLTDDQIEAARTIHGSGTDLLNLINEILDLSKIEAGRMELNLSNVAVRDLEESVRSSFEHMAGEKGLTLDVEVDDGAPLHVRTDQQRVSQVLRNLVSNAIKFTEKGHVTVTFGRPTPEVVFSEGRLAIDACLAITVQDTGIGIAPAHQKTIFEAFQQADGSTARRYGGTGLGLSISRELAHLLGGEVQLRSTQGEGSTFTLYLPLRIEKQRSRPDAITEADSSDSEVGSSAALAPVSIPDDRENLSAGDRTILVIEDDPRFARRLYEECHEKGFKCLAAPTGEAGLELAAEHLPVAAILDLRLPGMNGWDVLVALKDDIRTRHIPVHVVSAEDASTEALRKGAVGHATKPLDKVTMEETFKRLEEVSSERPRSVLVVEDNDDVRRKTVELIGGGDVEVDQARNGAEALEALRAGHYDCVVTDLGLPDMDGNAMLAQLEREGIRLPPVIVHTARDLTHDQEARLREHADSIVIKDVRSQERLLDEVSLFLHRVISQMPEPKRRIITDLHDTDALLRDKKVLVVDDDMRTTFAVSRLLSERGMKTLKAENGEKALRLLEQNGDIDLVLMDIMMPVMDGYEAIRRIREYGDGLSGIPIIALTAKAMPEDRRKCVEAGANDYMPKPVDPQRLVSMLRVWLYR